MEDSKLSFHVADVSFVTKSSLSGEFSFFEEGKKRFQENQIFATVNVCGNLAYAMNYSYDKCCFATDIFKICSDLYHNNFYNPKKWQFDIVSDNVIQGISCFFYKDLDLPTAEKSYANFHANRYNSCIDSSILESVTKWNLKDFEFLFSVVYSQEAKSIHHVLKRICHIYSQSFSINNMYERVILLCAVLDTLATNERQGKVRQLKTYLPLLVLKSKRLTERLKEFVEHIYEIRSAYIHNAECLDVTEQEVDKLEKIVYRVILQMIRNSVKYNSTKELCMAIDNDEFIPILDNLPDIYV